MSASKQPPRIQGTVFDASTLISQLQSQVAALKKDKLVSEALIADMIREKQAYQAQTSTQTLVEEMFGAIDDIKRMQESETLLLDEIEKQKSELQKVIEQPQIIEAMKYPLKAQICTLLTRDRPKKPT